MTTSPVDHHSSVKVWDPFVRLFHWTLAAGVSICLILEAGTKLHRWAGYIVVGLIAFRLVWGFVGGRYARFASFVTGPQAVLGYLRSLGAGRPRHYLGHNPAGGVMILVLLVFLALAGGSGALLNTDAFWGSDFLEAFHETVSEALYFLIPIHLVGVAVSSLLHKENLISAMITGIKRQ